MFSGIPCCIRFLTCEEEQVRKIREDWWWFTVKETEKSLERSRYFSFCDKVPGSVWEMFSPIAFYHSNRTPFFHLTFTSSALCWCSFPPTSFIYLQMGGETLVASQLSEPDPFFHRLSTEPTGLPQLLAKWVFSGSMVHSLVERPLSIKEPPIIICLAAKQRASTTAHMLLSYLKSQGRSVGDKWELSTRKAFSSSVQSSKNHVAQLLCAEAHKAPQKTAF